MKTYSHNFFFPEHTVPLHAMLINCGRDCERSSGDYYWDGLKRGSGEMQIWQYTLSGRGALRLGETVYELGPDTALFVEVPGDHAYYLPAGEKEWGFLYLSFFGREAGRLSREIRDRFGCVHHLSPDARCVRLASEILHHSELNEITTKYQSSRLAYEFVLAILEDLESGPGRENARDALNRRAGTFVLKHLAEPISVEALAEYCGYSRSHFTRIFHRTQHTTPGDFIANLRLAYAVRLLQTERLTVKEIAARCGFSDPSYFCRSFRRRYRISPDAFRNGAGDLPAPPSFD